MLAKEMMATQFDYNSWANGRILQKTALVTNEQLDQPSVVGERSLREILAHMVRIERVWRLLAETGDVQPDQLPSDDQLSSVDGMRSVVDDEQRQMARYLAELADNDLAAELTITRWDGIKIVMARWLMLEHMLLHSMQHRSEAAVLLTNFGRSPGDIDFLFFVGAD